MEIRTDWTCVAFTRTTGWEARDREGDDLDSYGGLLVWAEEEGLVDGEAAAGLRSRAGERPAEAARVLEGATRLRSALYETLTAVAREEEAPVGSLDELNVVLRSAASHLRLRGEGRSYEWTFEASARERLEWPVWRVARSAAELLTAEEIGRLKLCDAHDCGWLFIDASRNRSRRWCDMAECGNRAKARRFRERRSE